MKYQVKNEILKGLIGNHSNIDENLKLNGFTTGKGIGTTVLTYLVKVAFNIHRFPLWEDRHFTQELFTWMEGHDKLKQVFENDIFLANHDAMIKEIQEIYNFSQDFLNQEYYKDQDFVKLYRNLHGEYAAILLHLKNQAIEQNQKTIKISADILNSFTDNPYTYEDDVQIVLDVSKQNILYFSCIFNSLMESNEFIVLNQAKDGLIEIPVERIFKSRNNFDETRWRLQKYKDQKYYYCNFSINTQVGFGRHDKKRNYQKENLICNVFKRINKCCEV